MAVVAIAVLFFGCKVNYSFTGASIAPDVKTISIENFDLQAPLAKPSLGHSFTEALRDIFLRQTNLVMVRDNGDLQFDGEITGYTATPEAIQGNERAALTRLTITVRVRFTNVKHEDESFEQSFTQFEQFETSQSLASVEDQLIQSINEKLVQDIFNKSVSNW